MSTFLENGREGKLLKLRNQLAGLNYDRRPSGLEKVDDDDVGLNLTR